MIAFWITCFLMLGLALLILLPAFFRKTSTDDVDRNKQNIKIARQRLTELQADADTGLIAQSEFAATREELEQTLLGDLDDASVEGTRHSHPLWAVLVTIILPLMASGIYMMVGNPDALVNPVTQAARLQSETTTTSLVESLESRAQKNTDDNETLLQLAQEYMSIKRYSEAARTLETLRARTGDHPVLLVRNANALAMANEGKLGGRSIKLVEAALAIDPNQPQGLWLAGMAGFQRGDNQTALEYWYRLEPLIQQEDSDALAGIKKLIAQAETRLSSQKIASTTEPEATLEESLLRVTVKLDERLFDRVAPEDRLFVFAQSLNGPPMPLAVVSKRVEDLPLTVTLSDSMAILPEMRLSNFEDIRIGARISKSGDAIPQSGDFEGEISPVKLAEADIVEVIISKIIP